MSCHCSRTRRTKELNDTRSLTTKSDGRARLEPRHCPSCPLLFSGPDFQISHDASGYVLRWVECSAQLSNNYET